MTVWEELGKIDGFMEGASIFGSDDGDRAYFVDGKEVAHMDGPDTVGIRLTRKVWSAHRDELAGDLRVRRRSPSSDWVMVDARATDFVRRLAELAAEAHRPPAGATSKPPPEGAELARRRRFH